jgi:hypothetical protein
MDLSVFWGVDKLREGYCPMEIERMNQNIEQINLLIYFPY